MGSGWQPGHPKTGGPGTAAPRRSAYSELGSIVQLEAFLPQGNDEHCCECLDAYAAVHVFSSGFLLYLHSSVA
jgi:hypothetical protein